MKPSIAIAAVLALAAASAGALSQQPQSVWRDRPTRPNKQRPPVPRMTGRSDDEIDAWNAAVDGRRAEKKRRKI